MKTTINQFDRNAMRLLAGARSLYILPCLGAFGICPAACFGARRQQPGIGPGYDRSPGKQSHGYSHQYLADSKSAALAGRRRGKRQRRLVRASPAAKASRFTGTGCCKSRIQTARWASVASSITLSWAASVTPLLEVTNYWRACSQGTYRWPIRQLLFFQLRPPGAPDPRGDCGQQPNFSGCYVLTTAQMQPGYNFLFNFGVLTPNNNVESGLSTTFYFFPIPEWILQGNYTVPPGLYSIGIVQTLYVGCLNSNIINYFGTQAQGYSTSRTSCVAANACVLPASGYIPSVATLWGTLTSTTITSGGNPTPLAVTPGQIVQVTVTISFS